MAGRSAQTGGQHRIRAPYPRMNHHRAGDDHGPGPKRAIQSARQSKTYQTGRTSVDQSSYRRRGTVRCTRSRRDGPTRPACDLRLRGKTSQKCGPVRDAVRNHHSIVNDRNAAKAETSLTPVRCTRNRRKRTDARSG